MSKTKRGIPATATVKVGTTEAMQCHAGKEGPQRKSTLRPQLPGPLQAQGQRPTNGSRVHKPGRSTSLPVRWRKWDGFLELASQKVMSVLETSTFRKTGMKATGPTWLLREARTSGPRILREQHHPAKNSALSDPRFPLLLASLPLGPTKGTEIPAQLRVWMKGSRAWPGQQLWAQQSSTRAPTIC